MIGWYIDQQHKSHGFLRSPDGHITGPIDVHLDSAISSGGLGLNDEGDIVGNYITTTFVSHGYLLPHDGEAVTIEPPGAVGSVARAINARGEIVGFFSDGQRLHGFLRTRDGDYRQIDVPGADWAQAFAINSRGDIVGVYGDASGKHAFQLGHKGRLTRFDVPFPGGHDTVASGNNDEGDIEGFWSDAAGLSHSFLRVRHGHYASSDFPSTPTPPATLAFGIDSDGDIVGQYFSGGKWRFSCQQGRR
jgi:uncharacterized membrane protein